MEVLRKYGATYALLFRNSLVRDMAFKANFILWIITELLWFFGQLVFVEVMFNQTDRILDWTKWEVVLLIGTHQVISQIFQAFFYMNLANLPELVRTGKLDLMLLLPVDAQFSVSVRQFGLDNVVTGFVGIGIVGYSLHHLALVPSFAQWLLYSAALLLGTAIHYAVMFVLATASFWIVRAQGLIYGYFNLVSLARYPEGIYRGAFRFVFMWILPVILVANVPARLLIRPQEAPWPPLVELGSAALLALLLSRLLWNLALRRYSSASS
jgi:ABC-2 type transport system permease protein